MGLLISLALMLQIAFPAHRSNYGSGGGGNSYVASSYQYTQAYASTPAALTVNCGSYLTSIVVYTNGGTGNGSYTMTASTGSIVADTSFYVDNTVTVTTLQIFHLSGCSSGTSNITAVGNNGLGYTNLSTANYSGLTSNVLDAAGTATTSVTSTASCSASSTAAGHLVIGFVEAASDTGNWSSITSGYNARSPLTGNSYLFTDNLSSLNGTNTFSATTSASPGLLCQEVIYK